MNRIGSSDLDVFPICLGGNVFGWGTQDPNPLHCRHHLISCS